MIPPKSFSAGVFQNPFINGCKIYIDNVKMHIESSK